MSNCPQTFLRVIRNIYSFFNLVQQWEKPITKTIKNIPSHYVHQTGIKQLSPHIIIYRISVRRIKRFETVYCNHQIINVQLIGLFILIKQIFKPKTTYIKRFRENNIVATDTMLYSVSI